MLEQVLNFIHNYFIKEVYRGKFRISNNTFNCDFLQDGQYYKIIGSVFNDGVHKFPSDMLVDEEFDGEIWAMAVPPTVIALCEEINTYVEKYADKINSPFQSESFGGYSYTKASGYNSSGSNSNPADWRTIFASRLNHWRKIS